MSTPPKKHNCPILNFLKGGESGCGCKPAAPAEHSHDHHAHDAGHDHGHAHDHHHEHDHLHTHPHSGHDHGAGTVSGQHSHAHGHDHAHGHEHDQEHSHSHAAAAVQPPPAVADDGTVNEEQAKQLLEDLQAFDQDSVAFMDRMPFKRTEQPGNGDSLPHFDQAALDSKAYVAAREELRSKLLKEEGATRAAIASNDLAQNLVDSYSYTGLQSMQSNGLTSARLSVNPWSDYYWAICKGILGYRYADPGFPNTNDWAACNNYVRQRPASSVAVNQLSPSEKYDLLVGDSNFTLTKRMWAEGQSIYDRAGHVEAWMGICHGWAPAAYMLPRPSKSVSVLAADGRTQITFTPSDIKGLASLLWAKVPPQVKFIGGRCNTANPARDANGRLLDQAAFDTNPGTWHLAIVNQIGASKRSMVMDVTYDYEVWNQPVLGYKYYHFNPQAMTYQSSIAAASVTRANYTRDKFAQYHSSQTASIVGIDMRVQYIVETSPSTSSFDGSSNDAIKEARYLYDLELDSAGRIIGGEWRQLAHPDFLWTPNRGARAQTAYEPGGSWDRSQPVPSNWRSAAANASANSSAPLAVVVEHLIRFANS